MAETVAAWCCKGAEKEGSKVTQKHQTQQSRYGCVQRYLNKAQAMGTPLFQNTTLSQQDSLFPALQRFFIFSCFEHNKARRQRRTLSKPCKNNHLIFSPTLLRAQKGRQRIHHWMCIISFLILGVIQDSHKPPLSVPKPLIMTFGPAKLSCLGIFFMWIPRVRVSALGMLHGGASALNSRKGNGEIRSENTTARVRI